MAVTAPIPKPTPSRLLRELDQWSLRDLNKLVPGLLSLRARKLPSVVSRTEASLLKRITAGPPVRVMREYDRLMTRRVEQPLSQAEQCRLEQIIGEIDQHHLLHLQWLGELAALRRVTLPEVVRQLGLKRSL
ncbi:MAG: hypothetical protein ACKVY0_21160 [Prosthecobacter sp.]|uniref:hypothetical protein n=1 Tax=Prosthecobacter sp. TaxID=1965333 RepID=UPI0038FD6FA9